MICKICGSEMPNGVKFCSTCGNPIPEEEKVVAPVSFDPDATVIADPVEAFDPASRLVNDAPAAAPVPPVYQAPPAAPVFQQTPPATPVPPAAPVTPTYTQPAYVPPVAPVAPQKKAVNVKMIAIIGGAVALIAGIIILIVCLAGNSGKKDDDEDGGESSATVANVVKEAVADEYRSDYEFSNYKSEHKISVDGAYYQIYTADLKFDDEKGYLLGYAIVCGDEVYYFECEVYGSDEKEDFESDKKDLIDDAKADRVDYIEDLEGIVAEYNNEYEEEYDY